MLKGICLLICILVSPLASAVTCDATISPGTNINTGLARISSGQTLCLSNGVYHVSTTITLNGGKKLFGMSGDKTDVTLTAYNLPTASENIVEMAANTEIAHVTITYTTGPKINNAISAKYATNSAVWDVQITGDTNGVYAFDGGITILHSDNFQLLSTLIDNIGYPNDGLDHDAIYMKYDNDVTIEWGRVTGLNNGTPQSGNDRTTVRGSGDTACYDSDGLYILGTHFLQSGDAGIYLVACTNTHIDSAFIADANGWGLDAPFGDTNLLIENSTIKRSGRAASVFGEYSHDPRDASIWAYAFGAKYSNNDFEDNEFVHNVLLTPAPSCFGINVSIGPNTSTNPPTTGSVSGVSQSGNTLTQNGVAQPHSEYICQR